MIPMQLKHTIRIFFAILLIVVFSLKAGMGLYLHNYFHVKNNSNSSTGSAEIKFNCNCISDFYLPFTEISQQKISLPSFTYEERTFSYASSIFFSTSVFHSLRAPPITS
jgi:hypothetical protein